MAEYSKKVIGAILGALISIPSIAMGFYITYQVVTAIGN